ncbi:MAG TPA: mannosyltransferase family protein [Candidatus Saccharimonadales bacterium]|nr:mannosyltransferase family protein [Candidatus Saccharimonadales bacterium]
MKKTIPILGKNTFISLKTVFLLFLGFKIIDFIIVLVTPHFIPYLGFFPYKEELIASHLPHLLSSLANFDGAHYIIIARDGYYNYNQAYFPLYPLLMRLIAPLFLQNYLLAGIIISNVAAFGGLYYFTRILEYCLSDKRNVFFALILFLAFPTSFFLSAVYTEGLFFFLFTFSLYNVIHTKAFSLFISSFLAALTRLMGIFVSFQIFLVVLGDFKKSKKIEKKLIITIAAPILGFMLYAWYLLKTTGDPLFFFHAQSAFGAHRSTSLIILPQVYYRYAKIFLQSDLSFQYFISVIECIIFTFVFFILCYQLIQLIRKKKTEKFAFLLGLTLFSLSQIIVPSLTGTFSSIPRYALLSLSIFISLGAVKNKYLQWILLLIFALLHIALLGFFSQGYFVS